MLSKTIIKTTLPILVISFLAIGIVALLSFVGATKVYAASPATQSDPANSKAAANCRADQVAVQIDSGHDRGKWYCKDNPQTGVGGNGAGNGGGQAGGGRNGKTCGGPDYNAYTPSIDIGCRGQGNPIADAIFGIIRFLSAGVGLVIVGSIIVGGLQYSGSRGDPQATAMAVNRLRSSLYALLLFIFAYAILNYIIPAGFLNQ